MLYNYCYRTTDLRKYICVQLGQVKVKTQIKSESSNIYFSPGVHSVKSRRTWYWSGYHSPLYILNIISTMTSVLYVALPINLYKFFWPSIRGWFSHRSCIITWTCDKPCPNHWRGRCNHSHVETKTKTILCIFISLKDFWLILLQNVMWHVTSNQGQSRLNLIKNSMWSDFGFLILKIILWHFSFIIPSCIPSKPLVIKLVRICLETATQIMDVFQINKQIPWSEPNLWN